MGECKSDEVRLYSEAELGIDLAASECANRSAEYAKARQRIIRVYKGGLFFNEGGRWLVVDIATTSRFIRIALPFKWFYVSAMLGNLGWRIWKWRVKVEWN